MPEGEMPGDDVKSGSDSGSEGPDFHPDSFDLLDDTVGKYRSILRRTSMTVCASDNCTEVQPKHVEQARGVVARMEPPDKGLGMFSLLAGLCFAVALAIPDTSSLLFGKPTGLFLSLLRIATVVLIALGATSSACAFFVAKGNHTPKWVEKAQNALGAIKDSQKKH